MKTIDIQIVNDDCLKALCTIPEFVKYTECCIEKARTLLRALAKEAEVNAGMFNGGENKIAEGSKIVEGSKTVEENKIA
ncbi:hypothetical protein Ga0466249_003368 [Sporomusaceae bacterium BoRhaA]|uniref:hypothetical protein n=1 Tax=Pelorhabdus rhamnosifermentans TaxID=2772457 RepID=UPI001C05F65C|nr:hypothetical protein [Pelorhabdus rhamnosifermentans]MBU2702241.1 hypothetical protein [Pelorhabdus rhamnosifermentans]